MKAKLVCLAAVLISVWCYATAEAVLKYKGVNYVSWTRGEYPTTTSWKPERHPNAQAFTKVSVTSTNPYSGEGSLEIDVSLIGGSPTNNSGEVYVDLRYHPPLDTVPYCTIAPADLFELTITARVFCPAGSEGMPSDLNGLQLFVKDDNWRSLYGSWTDIDSTDVWYEISVTPDTVAPPSGSMDTGFDPTKVTLIGFRLGAGDSWSGSFEGTLWLDDVTWQGGNEPKYPFENIATSLDRLESAGANTVSLLVTWYMDNKFSTSIYRDSAATHTDDEIIATINAIHDRGLRVMLKPHIDVKDGTWRGLIAPSDIDLWFDHYRDSIAIHYARLASQYGVELLCVGTEFRSLDQSNRSEWDEIFDSVRSVCPSCTLTYAANWDGYGPVCFWDRVDILGIDAYFPLSSQADPSLADLLSGWTAWVELIRSKHYSTGKPVIFTEIGYSNRDYAANDPWAWCSGSDCGYILNCDIQARCYEAVIATFADSAWFDGLFWWDWFAQSDAGGCCIVDFTPQNKPAEGTLFAKRDPSCGDVNSSEAVDIDDVVFLIQYIFAGGPAPDPIKAGDTDCSDDIDIDDVVYLIAYIFLGGQIPCDPDGDEVPDC